MVDELCGSRGISWGHCRCAVLYRKPEIIVTSTCTAIRTQQTSLKMEFGHYLCIGSPLPTSRVASGVVVGIRTKPGKLWFRQRQGCAERSTENLCRTIESGVYSQDLPWFCRTCVCVCVCVSIHFAGLVYFCATIQPKPWIGMGVPELAKGKLSIEWVAS